MHDDCQLIHRKKGYKISYNNVRKIEKHDFKNFRIYVALDKISFPEIIVKEMFLPETIAKEMYS